MRYAYLVLATLIASALATATARAADAPKPVKLFILAGQSNMEGKAKVALLEYQANQPATADLFKHLRQPDGAWLQRDDVFIKFLDRKGKLTVGYGSPNCIGPELEFGNVVGDRYDDPVVLIKTAWGGRSLWRDFRPPSAGLPAEAVLQKMLDAIKAKKPAATMEEVKAPFGASYRAMIEEVTKVQSDLKATFPELAGRPCELAGLVWFQGWNDMISDDYTAEYAKNLEHFIRDVRRDLKAPNLPVVVAQMGVDGDHADKKIRKFKEAQLAGTQAAEFQGNVALVKTDAFWDTDAEAVFKKGWKENLAKWNTVGSDYPYHYLGSPKTMLKIGEAMANAMLSLRNESR
jgi:hypothetical protein